MHAGRPDCQTLITLSNVAQGTPERIRGQPRWVRVTGTLPRHQEYLKLAEEARRLALKASDPEAKRSFEKLADGLDMPSRLRQALGRRRFKRTVKIDTVVFGGTEAFKDGDL